MKQIVLYKIGVLATLAGLTLLLAWHPMYLSICQIDHNSETHSLEISLKVFTEDLEAALQARGADALRLGSESEHPSADSWLADYLQQQLVLQLEGKPLTLSYLGKEVKLDVTWCYLEVTDVKEIHSLDITDRLFTELFEFQTNIVQVHVGSQEKSLMLNREKPQEVLEF